MIEHLNDYNKILADLQNLEVEILDEDKVLLLLNSLPNAYDHLITTLLMRRMKLGLMMSLMLWLTMNTVRKVSSPIGAHTVKH